MELSYDWKGFERFFNTRRREYGLQGPDPVEPIYVVRSSDKKIASAYGAGEDLTEWWGKDVDELVENFPHRAFFLFDQDALDQTIQEEGGHFFEQVEKIRNLAEPLYVVRSKPGSASGARKTKVGKGELVSTFGGRQFLLDALLGWWKKFLPASYGLFVRLEGQSSNDFFVIVRRGRFETFHVPDLTSLGSVRSRELPEVVRYLSERHLIEVQGIFAPLVDWAEWSRMANPWKQIQQAIRLRRVKLNPSRFGLHFLIWLRARMGL